MTRNILSIFFSLLMTGVFAQAEKVEGIWLTQDGDSQIVISRTATKTYSGQIKWLKNPLEEGKPKADKKNPDVKLKTRPIHDLVILSGFKYNQKKNQWVDGTIYDPKSGKTYSCFMWFEDGNDKVLHLKGYVGLSWIGRQVVWTRELVLRK
jgi:uncharacterized protein (DUF2147 family)